MNDEERASFHKQLGEKTNLAAKLGQVVTGFAYKDGRLSVQMVTVGSREPVDQEPKLVNGYAKVERKPKPPQDRLL